MKRAFEYSATVTARSRGAFSMIAEATRSSIFEGSASVADLWLSLPGSPTPREFFGDRPRCLTLRRADAAADSRAYRTKVFSPTHGVFSRSVEISTLARIYPSTYGIQEHGSQLGAFGQPDPVYRFLDQEGRERTLDEVGDRAPWDDSFTDAARVVRPKIGVDAIGPPSEFLTFWALFFCLSELTRYYPDTWVAALNPDRSSAAVVLEQRLDLALERAPVVIDDALRGPTQALMREEMKSKTTWVENDGALSPSGLEPGALEGLRGGSVEGGGELD